MAEPVRWGPDNPHPLSKMKTELVWDGKYDEYGLRRPVDVAGSAMPMQKIETVDMPRSEALAGGQTTLGELKTLLPEGMPSSIYSTRKEHSSLSAISLAIAGSSLIMPLVLLTGLPISISTTSPGSRSISSRGFRTPFS